MHFVSLRQTLVDALVEATRDCTASTSTTNLERLKAWFQAE